MICLLIIYKLEFELFSFFNFKSYISSLAILEGYMLQVMHMKYVIGFGIFHYVKKDRSINKNVLQQYTQN